jgi:hypothetical protein
MWIPLTQHSKSVLQLLLTQGFLRADVNLAVGIEEHESPDHLLACQWDARSDEGIPAQIFPGIFLGQRGASTLSMDGIQQKLQTATPESLSRLAGTLDFRTEQDIITPYKNYRAYLDECASRGIISNVNIQRYIIAQNSQFTRQFAQLANLEGFEGMAAEDLAMAAGDRATGFLFEGLHACLENRYSKARSYLTSARQASNSDKFVYMLIAVCDMAGAEDPEDEDSGDED